MNDRSSIPPGIIAGLCVLLLVTAIVYLPGLGGPPLLDDESVLLPLMELDRAAWRDWLPDEITTDRGRLGRPVAMASFLANMVVHGPDLWYWKATNLFLHLLTGVVVFLLVSRLLRIVMRDRSDPAIVGWLALTVAGIWLLHPLQLSTVLYTVQRMTQLSALFVFAALLAYLAGRQRQIVKSAGGWLLVGLAFLLFFPLSVLSKENGVLFPLFALLAEVLLFRFGGGERTRRGLIALDVVALVLAVVTVLGYLLMNFETAILAGYEDRGFTAAERIMTQFRVLVYYLYQLLLPVQGNMGFFHDDFPVSRGLLDPPGTLLAALFIAGMILVAVLAWRRMVLPAFGVLFFLLGHSLEASFVSLELMFEHRNYLPAFGIFLCLAALLQGVLRYRRIFRVAGTLVLVVMAGLTAIRADTWGSYETFYTHAYNAHPESSRVNTVIANNLAEAGHYDAALAMMQKFDDPGFRLNRLYVLCSRDGQLSLQDVLKTQDGLQGVLGDHAVSGIINLANAGLDGKCSITSHAFVGLVDTLLGQPVLRKNRSKILIYKAHYQHRERELGAALETLREASRHRPGTPIPLLLGTEWLIDAGDIGQARTWYAQAQGIIAGSQHDFSVYTQGIEARLAEAMP